MSFNFIKYRRIFFLISGILIGGSIISVIMFGLNLGIDFTGGSILEIEYVEQRPSPQIVEEELSEFDLGLAAPQPTGEKGYILRMKDISEETHQKVVQKLGESRELEEKRFKKIGPIIGRELKQKTKIIIGGALIAIILYITFAFRKISRPIRSWQYGIAALVALFHDVFITVGVFSVLGKFWGVEISIPIVTALLTILGYSINDTVVVFDRVRENLIKKGSQEFDQTVNRSLNQILSRSVSTSLTTLFVLGAIFTIGGASLEYFALALIIGIILGTYSSLFLAPPMLVNWLKWREDQRGE